MTSRGVRPSSLQRRQIDRGGRRTASNHNQNDVTAGAPTTSPPALGQNTQLSTVLSQTQSSDLITDVRIPFDASDVLHRGHPALAILGHSSLVIQRQLEMMNILLGFEQANRYIIMNGAGNTVGYIAERDHGMGRALARQVFRTHRSFTTHIFDHEEREVLRIHRPFAYINSRIRIYDAITSNDQIGHASDAVIGDWTTSASNASPHSTASTSPADIGQMRIVGETQQQWAPLRRKYNLFSYRSAPQCPLRPDAGPQSEMMTMATEEDLSDKAIEASMAQFAHVDEPFLSWDFGLRSEGGSVIGSVNRNFGGFAREILTDTGVYALRMDAAIQAQGPTQPDFRAVGEHVSSTQLTLDQRAVMLATAISIDFDYFSRHSHSGAGGFMPMWFPGWGGGGAAGGAAAGEAGAAVGAAETAGAVGAVGRGAAAGGLGESAIAGAGTIAGYEAMQRGFGGSSRSEQAAEPSDRSQTPSPGFEEVFDPQGETAKSITNAYGDRIEGGQASDDDWWAPSSTDPNDSSVDTKIDGESGGGAGSWTDAISDFFGGD